MITFLWYYLRVALVALFLAILLTFPLAVLGVWLYLKAHA